MNNFFSKMTLADLLRHLVRRIRRQEDPTDLLLQFMATNIMDEIDEETPMDQVMRQLAIYVNILEHIDRAARRYAQEPPESWRVTYYDNRVRAARVNVSREKCVVCGRGLDAPGNFPEEFPQKYKLCCYCLDELNALEDENYKRKFHNMTVPEKIKEKLKLLCSKTL